MQLTVPENIHQWNKCTTVEKNVPAKISSGGWFKEAKT